MRRERSIEPGYFEGLYAGDPDPWKFETSDYEKAKYAHTLSVLPPQLGRVLEVGCSIGVLTAQLAPRCAALLAVDVSKTALAVARRRCAGLEQVTFQRLQLPQETPDGRFDAVILSEVVYYWDSADLARLADLLRGITAGGALLLLVHWTEPTDYPKSGDAAVEELQALLGAMVTVERSERRDKYRLDLWRRAD